MRWRVERGPVASSLWALESPSTKSRGAPVILRLALQPFEPHALSVFRMWYVDICVCVCESAIGPVCWTSLTVHMP